MITTALLAFFGKLAEAIIWLLPTTTTLPLPDGIADGLNEMGHWYATANIIFPMEDITAALTFGLGFASVMLVVFAIAKVVKLIRG